MISTMIHGGIRRNAMNTEDEEFERFKHEKKFRLDSTFTAVVSDNYYWIPIYNHTPQGVKVLLLGRSGVAALGHQKAE